MFKRHTEVKSTDDIIVEPEAKFVENMPPSVASSTVKQNLNEENLPKHRSVNKKVCEKKVHFCTTKGDERDASPVMDFLLGKDISTSDRENVFRKMSTLPDDDFLSLVQPFIRENSNDEDTVCEKIIFRPWFLCVTVQMLNLSLVGRQHVLRTRNAELSSSSSHKQMLTLPSASYFVEYEAPGNFSLVQPNQQKSTRQCPWIPKMHRLCSKRQIRDKIYFGQRSFHRLPPTRKEFEEIFNQSSFTFKVYSRFLNQRVPSLIGECVMSLVGIRESETLSKEAELPLYGNEFMILGFLSVKMELSTDTVGSKCIRTLPMSLQIQTKPKECLIRDRDLHDEPTPVAEKSDKISIEKKEAQLPSQILSQVHNVKEGLLGDRDLQDQQTSVAEKSDKISVKKKQAKLPSQILSQVHNVKEGLLEDRDLHNQPNPVAKKSDRTSLKRKQALLPSQILSQKVLLHGFLHIVEGRGFKPITSVLLCRGFWKNDVAVSNVCWNTSTPEYNFSQMIPVELSETLLNRCCCSFMVTEVWTHDGLLGITKLPLNKFYIAYHADFGAEQLKSNKYPVTCVDGWIDVVDLTNFQVMGQLLVLLAMGTEDQIQYMQTDRELKLEITAPPPSPVPLDVMAVTHPSELDIKEEMLSELSASVNILSKQHIPQKQNVQEIIIAHLSRDEGLSCSGASQKITIKQTQSSDNGTKKVMPPAVTSLSSDEVQSDKPQKMPQGHQHERCYQRVPLSKPQYIDNIQMDQRYFEKISENMGEFCDHSSNTEQSEPAPDNVHCVFELGCTNDESRSSFSSERLKQLRFPVISSDAEGLGTAASEHQGDNKTYYISKTALSNRQEPCDTEKLHRSQQLLSPHRQKQYMKSCICQTKHSIGTNTSTPLVEELHIGQGYEASCSAAKMPLISDLVKLVEEWDNLKKVLSFRNDKEVQTELASLPHTDKSTNTTSSAEEEKDCESLSGTTSELNPLKSFLRENAMTQTELDGKNSFHVLIEVESAIHLPLLNNGMAPNPYVTFQVGHGLGTTTVASPVVTRSTDPTWQWIHETWLSSQLLIEESKCLIMKLWHKVDFTSQDPDVTEDILVGFVAVDLSVLLYGLPHIRGWFNINDLTGHCKGQIKINVAPLETLTRFGNQTVNILQSCYTEEDQPRKNETQHLTVHGASLSPLNDLLKPCTFTSIQNVLETVPKINKETDSSEFEGIDQASEPRYVITEKHRNMLLPSAVAATIKATSIKAATALTTPAGEDSDNMTSNSDFLGDKFADKSLPFLSETLKQTLSEMDEITRRLKKRLETVIHKEDNPVSCYSCLEEETDINNPKISCDMLPLHATRQLCNEDSKCVDSNVGNRNDQFRKSQSQDLQRVVYTKHPFESSQKALDIKCGVPHQRKEATSEEEIQDKQSVPIKNPSSSIFRQEEGAVGGSTSTDCLMQMAAEEDGLENIFNPMLFQHLLSCYRDTYQCILGTAPGIHTGEEKQHVAFPYRGGQNKFMTEQDKGKIVGNDMNITHNFVCADKESNPIGEYKNQTFRSKNINQTFYSGDIIYSSTERLVDTGTLLASGDTKAQVTRYLSLLHNEHRPHSECDTKLSSSKEAIIKESTQEGNLEMKMGFTNDKEDTIMPSQTFPIDNGGDGIDQCSNVNSKLNNVNKQFDELSKSRIASDKLVTEEQNSTADILGKSYLEESQSKGNFVNSESESPVEVHLVSQTQEIPVEIDNREVEMSSLTTSTTITAATLPQPTTTTTTTRQEDTMCTDRSHGGVHQATPLLIDRDEIRRIAKIFNPRMKDSHTY